MPEISTRKMRLFAAVPSERVEADDWVLREAVDGGFGPPLRVGSKEAIYYLMAKLNREEQKRYRDTAMDPVIADMTASLKDGLDQLIGGWEEEARAEGKSISADGLRRLRSSE